MKKRIAAVILSLVMLISFTPLTSVAQEVVNPFAGADSLRQQNIVLSQKHAVSEEAASSKSSSEEGKSISDSYIVQFKKSVSLHTIFECVSHYSYQLLANSKNRLFEIGIGDLSDFKSAYGSLVESVSKSTQQKLDAIPNDTYYSSQWALPDIHLPEAWDITTGSSSVKVAVIDSGVYRSHEDLSNTTVLSGYDFFTNTPNVTTDEAGHGTMVTSVIAATANNAKGMVGGCWNITVIPCKVANSEGLIDSADAIRAIIWAADAGCDVINMSFGGYDSDPSEQTAINYALSKGCIIVAAAGNEGSSTDVERGQYSYPASYNGVISAASIDTNNVHSYFSQYNDKVDVCAPGEDIVTADTSSYNSYCYRYPVSGTSFSSPYVAAVAALARSEDDSITASYFEQLIKETSTDLGTASKDNYYGWGLVNAYGVVKAAQSPIVCGVDSNAVYTSPRTVTFNKGTATLTNTGSGVGKTIQSGDTVSDEGKYSLSVTDSDGHTTTVPFMIDSSTLSVDGIQDGGSYNTSKTITFTGGTATLTDNGTGVGKTILSGNIISAEGSYTLVWTSPVGRTSTCTFTIDKTAPVVTGVTNGASYDTLVTIGFNEGTAVLTNTGTGAVKTITNSTVLGIKGSYKLVVTDTAGNVTTVNFTITSTYTSGTKLSMPTALTQWVLDEANSRLFAISNAGKSLICINTTTMTVSNTISLEAAPTDIIEDGGKLYIALDSADKIVVIDAATLNIDKTLVTMTDPCRIVKDGNMLYYVQQGQISYLHKYSLDTNVDSNLGVSFSAPDLAVNTDKHMLYIGESQNEESRLHYFNIANNSLVSTSNYRDCYGYYFPDRTVVYDGNTVFYAGIAFSPDSATVGKGDYDIENKTILFAKGGCVFTSTSVYDEETHVKAGNLSFSANLVEATQSGNVYFYDQTNSCVLEISCASKAINADDIIAQTSGTPVTVPTITEKNGSVTDELNMTLESRLSKWVLDDDTNTIYGVSYTDKALFFIDATTLDIKKTLRFISEPNDLIVSNGKLYLALEDVNEIVVIDADTQTIEKTLNTSFDPFALAIDGNSLYYSRDDNIVNIYEYDLSSDTDSLIISNAYSPCFAVNDQSHILYFITEDGVYCTLCYFSTVNNKVIDESGEYEDYPYSVTFDGNYVYFNGRIFSPYAASVLGIFSLDSSETVLAAKDGYIYTDYGLYYFDDIYPTSLVTFDSEVTLAAMSDQNDIFIYNGSNNQIIRADGDPKITGVEDGKVYSAPVTISFNKGTATLDGKVFSSGSTVSASGDHTLVVLDSSGYSTTADFTVITPQSDDNTPVSFNDSHMTTALIDNGADADNNGVITRGEMRMLSSLQLDSCGITDLTGLNYAVNLKLLDLSGNSIFNITPLAGLTGLNHLDLCYNQISNISALSGLTKINYLDLSDNVISSITALASCQALSSVNGCLFLEDNQITDISTLTKLSNLPVLSLSGNPITNFIPLQSLTKLQYLGLSNCGLTTISVLGSLTDLMILDISDNGISNISALKNMTYLTILNASGNIISDISPLQNLIYLNVLNLSDNQIDNISIIQNLYLFHLDISENFLDLTSSDMTVINSIIGGDEDLTINYTPQKQFCTVTFNSQGGTAITGKTAEVNTTISAPSYPTRTGYTFAGWYTAASGGTKIAFPYTVTANTTLYAHWTSNIYTVAFNSQGGTAVSAKSAAYNTTISAPSNPSRTGYTFAGWYTAASGGTKIAFPYTVKGNATLYAHWTANTYTVTFSSQGGTAVSSKKAAYNTSITAPSNPSKSGYTFAGWYTAASGGTKIAFPYTVKGNATLYAHWTANTYTITFNSQGGTTVYSKKAAYNTTITAPSNPSKSGYSFAGWYTAASGGTKITFPYKMTSSKTLYAHWTYFTYVTPSGLKASSAGYSSVKLTWSTISGASGYQIYRATSYSGTYYYQTTTSYLSYTNTGLTAGKTYYYKIRAYQTKGSSRIYSKYSSYVAGKPIPSTPSGLKAAKVSSSSIKLTWYGVSGASGYEIYRATSSTGTYSLIKTTTSLYYTNTGLSSGRYYYYKIRAYRIVSGKKVYSNYTAVVYAKT